jgi:DNA-directed RNA polymerase subunit RPC12/RpoP
VFGISFEELILLLVLALILFGPERLPEIAEKIGRWVAKLRQAGSEMSQQYQQVLNPLPLPMPPPPMEYFCPHCSHKVEQRVTFCPHCGQRWEEEPPRAEPHQEHFAHCPRCGRQLESDFLFCPACGHHRHQGGHYPPPEPPPLDHLVTCPQCSRKLESDFLFCPGCGHAFSKTEPPKPPAP